MGRKAAGETRRRKKSCRRDPSQEENCRGKRSGKGEIWKDERFRIEFRTGACYNRFLKPGMRRRIARSGRQEKGGRKILWSVI